MSGCQNLYTEYCISYHLQLNFPDFLDSSAIHSPKQPGQNHKSVHMIQNLKRSHKIWIEQKTARSSLCLVQLVVFFGVWRQIHDLVTTSRGTQTPWVVFSHDEVVKCF